MERNEEMINKKIRWINAVAGKLGAEGMTKESYNQEKAKAIISKCIMPTLLIEILLKHETEIKEKLL